MKLHTALATLTAVLSMGFGASAWAACSNPTGNAGAQMYAGNYGVMAYCNGTNWISMAGGVSQTVNTTGGGGATPAGSSADVQFNSGGALAADTGVFTYSSGLLKSTSMSATNISATTATLTNIGAGSINASGQVSAATVLATQVSASNVSVTLGELAPSTITNIIGAGGNSILSGTASVSTSSSATGGTIKMATGSGLVMTITGTNVGIGTTNPQSLAALGIKILDLTGTNPVVTLHNAADPLKETSIINHTTGTYFDSTGAATAANNAIYFRTNNTSSNNNSGLINAMTILSSGNVGIGTSSPANPLDVFVGGTRSFYVNSSNHVVIPALQAQTSTLCFSGGVGEIGFCSSDRRIKRDIHPITADALGLIVKLKPSNFIAISDKTSKVRAGFIAQEVMKVIPEAVSTVSGSTYLSFDSGAITSYSVKAIQELKNRSDTDHLRLVKLETENDNLRSEFEAYRRAHP